MHARGMSMSRSFIMLGVIPEVRAHSFALIGYAQRSAEKGGLIGTGLPVRRERVGRQKREDRLGGSTPASNG